MDSLIFKDGLRIGKHELELLQTTQREAMTKAIVAMTGRVPAILANRNPDGTLSSSLRVDISETAGDVIVRSGTAIFPSGAVITVPETTLTIGVNAGNRDIVLTTQTVTTLPGLVNVTTTGGVTTISGFSNPEKYYSTNSYIRLTQGATVYGTYRIATINNGDGTMTLADTFNGPSSVTGVTHAVGGKFFPGYPLGVETTNILSQEVALLQVLEPLAGVPAAGSTQILLARVNRTGSGAVTYATGTTADSYRVQQLLSPNISGVQLTNGNIADNAAIAESKIALTTETTQAKTMRHTQNTDTHTTANAFYVGVASGAAPNTGKRVLTTDDIGTLGSDGAGEWPDIVNEPSYDIVFARTVAGALPYVAFGVGFTTGTVTANGANQTVTAQVAGPRTIQQDEFANCVLYDTSGSVFRISANTPLTVASGQTGQFTITASRTDIITDVQKAFSGSTGSILSSAATHVLHVYEDFNGNPGSEPRYTLSPVRTSTTGPVFRQFDFVGQEGKPYHFRLMASRSGKNQVVQTLRKVWGASNDSPTSSLNIVNITASSNSGTAIFSWDAPSGYNKDTMDYSISVQRKTSPTSPLNPTTPSYSVWPSGPNFIEYPSGGGQVTLTGAPDEEIILNVRVVNLGRQFLDTTPATSRVIIPSIDLSTLQRIEARFKNITDTSFINISGILSAEVRDRVSIEPRNAFIHGFTLSIDSFAGAATAAFKAIAYPDESYNIGVYSSEFNTRNHTLGPGTVNISTAGVATFSQNPLINSGARIFLNGRIFRLTSQPTGTTTYTANVTTLAEDPAITTAITGATYFVLTPLSPLTVTFPTNSAQRLSLQAGLSIALEKIGTASITDLSGSVVVYYRTTGFTPQ